MLCVELWSTVEGWSTTEPGSLVSSVFAGDTWWSSVVASGTPGAPKIMCLYSGSNHYHTGSSHSEHKWSTTPSQLLYTLILILMSAAHSGFYENALYKFTFTYFLLTYLTFDLFTLKVVSESRATWATSVPILVFLGLSVLDLGPMYATDRRQTDKSIA